jgi:hypothetical protein
MNKFLRVINLSYTDTPTTVQNARDSSKANTSQTTRGTAQAIDFSTVTNIHELIMQFTILQCQQYALVLKHSKMLYQIAPTIAARILLGMKYVTD